MGMGGEEHTTERTIKSSLRDVMAFTPFFFNFLRNVPAHVEEITPWALRLEIKVASFNSPSWKWHML